MALNYAFTTIRIRVLNWLCRICSPSDTQQFSPDFHRLIGRIHPKIRAHIHTQARVSAIPRRHRQPPNRASLLLGVVCVTNATGLELCTRVCPLRFTVNHRRRHKIKINENDSFSKWFEEKSKVTTTRQSIQKRQREDTSLYSLYRFWIWISVSCRPLATDQPKCSVEIRKLRIGCYRRRHRWPPTICTNATIAMPSPSRNTKWPST